jgi:hypothetical protein
MRPVRRKGDDEDVYASSWGREKRRIIDDA